MDVRRKEGRNEVVRCVEYKQQCAPPSRQGANDVFTVKITSLNGVIRVVTWLYAVTEVSEVIYSNSHIQALIALL